ncbi:energy-coupling factor ABC transporter ATP-binding protein [Streptomyces iconiensis]|uniref:ABC transporter ATP-binding protein n=1 Tax=Streptomyces iconiensis TaxID=1384038 RepID=A0ABT7A7H6_9ACTN|nr:ABC transporter ATP-binding protein [Streptomyces iconiensis]MDJ1136796.1 ABC transporter ATP-binding protein [Streptomyces iconiensis]
MSPQETVIEITDVEHTYGRATTALAGVNLRIGRGEFVAVIGRNGSGKTTLAKHFNGLLRPTNPGGTVRLHSRDGTATDTRGARLHHLAATVGYVFQNPDRQIFHDTCREELAYGPLNLGADPEASAKR